MSDLKAQIQEDMKTAMRSQDKQRLGTIRMLMAAIKQREIDEQITLDDTAVLAVINKMIKQRRDSITQYEAAGRDELAAVEKEEITVLQAYLPEQLSTEEVEAAIAKAIETSGAESMKDMGKVMGILKPQLQGRADMGEVSKLIKARLS